MTTSSTTTAPDGDHMAQLLTELYTFEEVAERFHIPESTLRYWVQSRTVQHTRVGRHVRFSAEDIDKIIRSGRVPAQGNLRSVR